MDYRYIITDLGHFGGRYCQAYDINNASQVVGSSWTSKQSPRAFLWENGRMKLPGKLRGRVSTAFVINDFGQIAGWGRINTAHDEVHAFVMVCLAQSATRGSGSLDS